MTQLATWIGRDRALVGADTRVTPMQVNPASPLGQQFAHETAIIGGRMVETSKLLALPHARLVLAHAGPSSFLGAAFLACQAQMGADDFDALDAKMPGILGGAFESVLGQHRTHYPEVSVEAIRGQLLVMVGWSEKGQRMRGVLFNQNPQQEGFQRLPLAGFTEDEDERGSRFAAPWSLKSGQLPYASTPAVMEYLAHRQMLDFGGTAAGRGGRLLVAELTRDSIAITSQCDLEAAPVRPAPDVRSGGVSSAPASAG